MNIEEKVIKIAQENPTLIKDMLNKFCPMKFGIANSFIEKVRYSCTRGCYNC